MIFGKAPQSRIPPYPNMQRRDFKTAWLKNYKTILDYILILTSLLVLSIFGTLTVLIILTNTETALLVFALFDKFIPFIFLSGFIIALSVYVPLMKKHFGD